MFASQRLGRRWTLLVLRELLGGPKRFSSLQKILPWIPAKSLARVLERLETNGMIERHVLSARPSRVSYSMAQDDALLRGVVEALTRWGMQNYRLPGRKHHHH